jgi:Spy/CpxP family protein refolding chaperone
MWWQDADVKRELALTDEKAQRIDQIFQGRQKLLTPMASDFLKEKAVLDRMTAERTADDGTYALQVWRVEALRSKLNESRLMMLYRIYRELQPDQYKKLQAISDRKFDPERARGGPGR